MISDFKIEKYLQNALPKAEMENLKSLESLDSNFKSRVEFLRKNNEEILAKYPYENLEKSLAYSPKKNIELFLVKVSAAAILLLSVLITTFYNVKEYKAPKADSFEVAALENTRIKGLENRLEIWKKNGANVEELSNLDEVKEGDEVQLRFAVAEKCFGMIFSMDGNGILTIHLGNEKNSIELLPGKMTALPYAYKFDNAPKFEKFFLVTSNESFALLDDIDKTLENKKVESITLKKVN